MAKTLNQEIYSVDFDALFSIFLYESLKSNIRDPLSLTPGDFPPPLTPGDPPTLTPGDPLLLTAFP